MRKLLLTAFAAALAGPALADTYSIDKSHSEVSFQVTHLGISKVRGQFKEFTGAITGDPGKPETASVELTIDAKSIDTGVADRDKHLRSGDFFEAEKFPTLTFKSTKIVPKGGNNFDVTGTLTIKGVSKTVTLPVKMVGPIKDPWGNERAGFETSTVVARKDYGVSWNKALDGGGFVVGEDVQVSINLETAKDKPASK